MKEQVAEKKVQVEELQLLLGKREEEVAQALMKVDEEAAAKAQAQKGLRELEAMIQSLRAAGQPRDQALAERLAERRAALFVQAAAFVERQSQLYASESGRRMRQ